MFAGEGMIKKYYDKAVNSSSVKNGIKNLSKNKIMKPVFEYLEKHQLKGKAGAIIKGLLFVGGSMTSYAIGQKFGETTAKRVKANVNALKQ